MRGLVQLSFSRSIDPILPLDLSITRMAATEAKEADSPNQTVGRKNLIPYGLYRCHGFISAHLARETGFSDDDLALFWNALKNMFDHDRSAARGSAGEVRSMLSLLERRPWAAEFKPRLAALKSLAESCSRQLHAWAQMLQNSPDSVGQRRMTDQDPFPPPAPRPPHPDSVGQRRMTDQVRRRMVQRKSAEKFEQN